FQWLALQFFLLQPARTFSVSF
ncbi:hypothetical protein D030_3383B, partial [Vibrio parahaemolyticus AQ3810]